MILMSLPGPYAMNDSQVGAAIGKSPGWVTARRRHESFAKALRRTGQLIAWSYTPEILGQVVEMARRGDKGMINLFVKELMPNNDSPEAVRSMFGEAMTKVGSEQIEAMWVRRTKPGHHKSSD